jgi:hypothetical protein
MPWQLSTSRVSGGPQVNRAKIRSGGLLSQTLVTINQLSLTYPQ